MNLEADAEAQAEVQEEPPQFVPPPVGRLLLKISTAAPMGRILCPEECWYQGFLGGVQCLGASFAWLHSEYIYIHILNSRV